MDCVAILCIGFTCVSVRRASICMTLGRLVSGCRFCECAVYACRIYDVVSEWMSEGPGTL